MIILIILIGLFCPASILAAPQILITDHPESVVVGDTFPLIFNVSNAEIGTTYHYKAVGDSSTDISIFPSCAGRYDDCSNLITSSIDSNTATAYAKINSVNNFNKIKIRIAQSDKHSSVFEGPYINIISFLPSPTPTAEIVPTLIPTPEVIPTITVEPTPNISNLIVSEIMANPDSDQDEWIEIYNPNNYSVSLKDSCIFDVSNHSRCFSGEAAVAPNSYYSHSFSSGFLNNDGDTVNFQNTSVTYFNSPKGFSYSRQENGAWCFTSPSQNLPNLPCTNIVDDDSASKDKYPSPLLSLQFVPDSVTAGDDFNLVFNLRSSEQFSLRIISPFGSPYFPFSDFHDGYSWLTIPLSVPKKTPEGVYPLSFHLKKAGSSHLYDYQLGNLDIKSAPIVSKRSKVLGVSTLTCPRCQDNSATVNYLPASTLKQVPPDYNFFSWPFLFVGSILFLSPILFPKLYSA